MKHFRQIFAFFILLNVISPIYCIAQEWEWQNPLPQGDRLGEVQFVNSLYGWILTEGGTILRTIDGGNSWNVEVSVKENNRWAQKIYFIDRLHGWGVGSGAPPFILRTQDGGKTWEDLPIPVERNTGEFYNFYGLHFLDTLNGYITDDLAGIFHTKNGGLSWEKQSANLRPKREIRSVFFVDSMKGFAIGQTPLLYTKDGGSNWFRDSTVMGGIDILPRKIFFTDTLYGWILAGDEKFYRTADGGMNWKQYIIDSMAVGHFLHPTFGEFIAREFMFLNPQQGWLSTSWGMHSSLDSGKTWHRINTEFDYDGVYFVNTKLGWATGGVKPSLRNVYFRTLDGGVTWQSQTTKITEQTLWGVDFIDENSGWAVGVDGTIVHTNDGGKTWSHQTSPSTSWLKKVIFLNRTEGWIVGFGGTILHTTNGGQIWQQQNSGTYYALVEGSFVSPKKGWVVGWGFNDNTEEGILLHTSNGGASWQNQTQEGIGRLFGVAFIDSLRGWIATGGGSVWDDGQLYRTQDGGQSWELQVDKPDDAFGRIVFVDSLYGWVAALKGILQTTDGGRTWETKARAMSVGLFNIRFADRRYGWAVGSGGIITHTSDGGENWLAQQSKTGLTLWDIDFVNENSGWAVGYFGTILHTGKGGATSFENKPNPPLFPLSFELYQNYPNPFNSETVINFILYEPYAKVSLNIYNTMGQLVTTLLNEELPADHHRIIWDGTDQNGEIVGSGVYLYRINVNSLNKAGKMILLR